MDWTEDIPVFRAQLADARRDLRRRLAVDLSEQERLYVRPMAEHLGDLERISRLLRNVDLPGGTPCRLEDGQQSIGLQAHRLRRKRHNYPFRRFGRLCRNKQRRREWRAI